MKIRRGESKGSEKGSGVEGRGEGEEKGEGKTKEGRREHPPLAGLSWAHGLRERTPPPPQ